MKQLLKNNENDDKIRALAHSLVINEVDVCGLGMFNGLEVAKEVLKTLIKEGYNIKLITKKRINNETTCN